MYYVNVLWAKQSAEQKYRFPEPYDPRNRIYTDIRLYCTMPNNTTKRNSNSSLAYTDGRARLRLRNRGTCVTVR